ncbi:hypothetical protein [Actinomadura kijaniata]|uniref:hypothetical protein n=1 Tax=Actinomadura kijaniata TaxID=46161 RepID=UPI00082F2815|nr:hypothetical protein [Actinomadura kijaniata]
MSRVSWKDLPVPVRRAVTERAGRVLSMDPAPRGAGSDLVATLHTSGGRIFLKGSRLEGPRADVRRIETRVQPFLPERAPRMLWHAEAAGWLLMAFEHVDGRHADLSPGSADLGEVAALLAELSHEARPDLPVLPVKRRWAPFAASAELDLLRGDILAHMDLNAGNILIGPRSWVVDWAWPSRAAAWLDTASMVVRLIEAGHSPQGAERWAQQVPAWKQTTSEALRVYTGTRLALADSQGSADLAVALRAWRAYLDTSPVARPRSADPGPGSFGVHSV